VHVTITLVATGFEQTFDPTVTLSREAVAVLRLVPVRVKTVPPTVGAIPGESPVKVGGKYEKVEEPDDA